MNIEDVKSTLETIEVLKGDDESAHISEKCLWKKVLEEVAKGGNPDIQAMAKEALKSDGIHFSRWYA